MEMFSIPSLCNSEFGRAAEDHWYWIKIGEMFRFPICAKLVMYERLFHHGKLFCVTNHNYIDR